MLSVIARKHFEVQEGGSIRNRENSRRMQLSEEREREKREEGSRKREGLIRAEEGSTSCIVIARVYNIMP